MSLFSYVTPRLERRHGPCGYVDYRSYKPWLRDEATFRCVYCLARETLYPNGLASFGIDHLTPQSATPERVNEYDNLAYACLSCNSLKGSHELPLNPYSSSLGEHLAVREDGRIEPLSSDGAQLIAILRLDNVERTEFRRRWLQLVRLLEEYGSDDAALLLERLLGFPESLPDLSALRPPAGNTRPEGIVLSYFVLRERGLLPGTY
jgi:hypothetical protein